MAKGQQAYNNESISSLKGPDKVRLRPGVIFGSDDIAGCQHAVFEILANSIDEAREGYGNTIEVSRFKDHSIQIVDYGRGIPLEYNPKEDRFNWELVFCELYAGGKYQNIQGLTYEYSLGLNGLGACATQFAASWMNVEVLRDKHRYHLRFEKGHNIGGLKKEKALYKDTGTRIHWLPDLDVFTEIDINQEYFKETLKRQAVVNAGVHFVFYDELTDESFTYYYPEGIMDYIKELSQEQELTEIRYLSRSTAGRDREDKPEYKVKMEIALCFNNHYPRIEYYHNSSYLEHGGAPDRAVKNSLVAVIDQFLKDENLYRKNEKKVLFTDIEDSLLLIANSFSTMTSYANQTKKSINNTFIQQAMTALIKEKLEIYFTENRQDKEKILNQVLTNKRSRETAEQTRLNIKKKLNGKMDMATKVKKFVDCRSKDLEKRELFIVEGDSALGATKMGRDANFQAIIPVRGKILNCLKASYAQIFGNDIIVDLLKVLGCGVEIKSRHSDLATFDLNKLRWNKIIICTDADVDGYQIRTLILTMLYVLTPKLIEMGYVYIAESPLYEITDLKAKKTFFAYTEQEKNKLLKSIKGTYKLQRSKGLGENEPQMMWETTMNPDTRRLIQVTPAEAAKTREMFDVLLGNNLPGRKLFITDKGPAYIAQADLD
ncbi:DNA gyrase/topoisomerase IV subunit B [Tindallia californiensis]|uniref:DNA topoisomerase (ATP-hydrolyzing) n=1 Tax=Tindallia californiensis TaxID=159292 RepID=A0A1H3MLZ7_9FIRM|nr:toprim domain-containing protein [Tindallia californiensis]SDY77580.1 DNA gyrase subunit B [Tindallia californiensis]